MSAETETEPDQPAIPAEVEEEGNKTATERLVFFSDAVIAIAITLLALDLPIPHGNTPAQAWGDFGRLFHEDYLAFLISFLVIANQWFGHHALYRYVNRVHRRVAAVNMLWLLTIVVTPFATRVLVGDTPFPMAFTLYAGIQAASQLTYLALVLMIRHDHLSTIEVPSGVFTRGVARSLALAAAYLISIPIAYHTHWAYAIWALNGSIARLATLAIRHRITAAKSPVRPAGKEKP
jgi:uncharacterized membrane protein